MSSVLSAVSLVPGEAPAEDQPTTGATRPVPPSTEPPPRRRRTALVIAIVACAVLGSGAGVSAAFLGSDQPTVTEPTPTPTPTSGSTGEQYWLEVYATSPEPGTVTLQFRDMTGEPGFVSYTILRDGGFPEEVPPGADAPPYTITGLDEGKRFCFEVLALLMTDVPPPTPAPPQACLVADGEPR
jgi:serine/threonine-protein kinase